MLIFGIRIAARPLTWQALWVGEKKKEINNDYFSGRKSSESIPLYPCSGFGFWKFGEIHYLHFFS